MLLCFRFVIDMGLAVEAMVGHLACSGILCRLIIIPRDAGEMHPVQYFAGIGPLDEIGCSGREGVSCERRDVELQRSVHDRCAGKLIDLHVIPVQRRTAEGHAERQGQRVEATRLPQRTEEVDLGAEEPEGLYFRLCYRDRKSVV